MVSGLPEFILNVLWLLHFSHAKANSSVSVFVPGLTAASHHSFTLCKKYEINT